MSASSSGLSGLVEPIAPELACPELENFDAGEAPLDSNGQVDLFKNMAAEFATEHARCRAFYLELYERQLILIRRLTGAGLWW